MQTTIKGAIALAVLLGISLSSRAQTLTQLSPDAVPPTGTFFSAQDFPPAPVDWLPGLPVYSLGQGNFVIDDTSVDYSNLDATGMPKSADGGRGMRPMEIPILPGGGGGGGTNGGGSTNGYVPYTFDTNGLWLEIVNVGWWINLNLHNGSTNRVYAILCTTNLPNGWHVEQGVCPTNPVVMPFVLSSLARPCLFLRAEDWTGVTENGNTTPDWWFWNYFGTTNLSDTNLDSSGNTLLYDYQNGLDPNIIAFSLSATNQYVNTSSATVQISVSSGVPSYMAVLVDSSDASTANWMPFNSNCVVNLGSVEGWHDVWVGLRGLPSNATQTWQWQHLNLTLPPVLVITNPVANVVSQPMIQINGCCQEPLASISYDISNAAGIFANQPSEITDQYYDTNSCGITTNYFECLDVPLTNGLNTITIHATDLAGDTTITNFNFTLDYSTKTNPPVVQITWPQNGTQISGSNFTCLGWMSDPTATVTAQLASSTNMYPGLVERNGNFWLENLPINAGTNVLSITVVDVVGNSAVTNISVVQSPLAPTINPVTPDSQLWQPTVTLTGTISDSAYAIWVNGVKGHNNADTTWFATNVPVNSGGTATFTATAYAPGEQQPDGSYGN